MIIRKHDKKKKSHYIIKLIVFLIVVYFSCNITFSLLIGNNLTLSNEDFLKFLISESNHNYIFKYSSKDLFSKIFSFFSNIDINKPISILGISFINKDVLAAGYTTEDDDSYDPNALEKISDYVKDPSPDNVSKPIIYIYNSHQLENYNAKDVEIYNIRPNVMMSSYMLKEKLNSLGISSVAEEANLTELMRVNNWDHADSYKASRIVILDAKEKYNTLKYYIDIHRDSVKKDVSTIEINKKSYAKTLFVVGLENSNYRSNLQLAQNLNNIIDKKYPGLSRGILKKKGAGVNGVYNQDISPNMFLLEVGGVDNSIEEVLNTIDAIADVIYTYIEDTK